MHKIGLVLYPNFGATSFAAMAAFEITNLCTQSVAYEMTMVSQDGGNVRSSMGAEIATVRIADFSGETLMVAGADRLPIYDASLLATIRDAPASFRRVGAMCTGSFALAEAGLLGGRKATTHWYYANLFRQRFPDVTMHEDRIYVVDGPFWTSAGMTAGTDMALGMVERDMGAAVAKDVARLLVMYSRRSGGQLQFSALLEMDAKSDRIQNALSYARQNLASHLSVDDLARVSNLSTRQFSRAFRVETGQSPAKAIERMRVEVARQMLEEGRHPIDFISRETGFNDPERMRKAFMGILGHPPQAIRRAVRL